MNRLKELRIQNKLTLKKVAIDNNLAESQLSYFENGKREPRDKETWKKLADYFSVSVGYLMGISEKKISDEYALKIAHELYDSYLKDDELNDDEKKALNYSNNEHLDETLSRMMNRFLSIPIVQESEKLQTLENKGYLIWWLKAELIEKYMKEVKTNHNLIENVYAKIPIEDEIYNYPNFPNHIELPINEIIDILVDNPVEKNSLLFGEWGKISKELGELNKSDNFLSVSNYEESIDEELMREINYILDDTREKIKKLRTKYPDKPSNIQQSTMLISRGQKREKIWNINGNDEFKDELNLAESTKKTIIMIGAYLLKLNQKNLEEK